MVYKMYVVCKWVTLIYFLLFFLAAKFLHVCKLDYKCNRYASSETTSAYIPQEMLGSVGM
jgi:hypothetical protein